MSAIIQCIEYCNGNEDESCIEITWDDGKGHYGKFDDFTVNRFGNSYIIECVEENTIIECMFNEKVAFAKVYKGKSVYVYMDRDSCHDWTKSILEKKS